MREQIGKGAFGAAMLVYNREDQQEYVMKRVRLARQTEWQRKASFQEMEIVRTLPHCPVPVTILSIHWTPTPALEAAILRPAHSAGRRPEAPFHRPSH